MVERTFRLAHRAGSRLVGVQFAAIKAYLRRAWENDNHRENGLAVFIPGVTEDDVETLIDELAITPPFLGACVIAISYDGPSRARVVTLTKPTGD